LQLRLSIGEVLGFGLRKPFFVLLVEIAKFFFFSFNFSSVHERDRFLQGFF